jgi:hypothetical protein
MWIPPFSAFPNPRAKKWSPCLEHRSRRMERDKRGEPHTIRGSRMTRRDGREGSSASKIPPERPPQFSHEGKFAIADPGPASTRPATGIQFDSITPRTLQLILRKRKHVGRYAGRARRRFSRPRPRRSARARGERRHAPINGATGSRWRGAIFCRSTEVARRRPRWWCFPTGQLFCGTSDLKISFGTKPRAGISAMSPHINCGHVVRSRLVP